MTSIDLCDLGTCPPLGVVPKRMVASLIRRERFGPPRTAFQSEVVDVPPVGPSQVLVMVMAEGIDFHSAIMSYFRVASRIGDRTVWACIFSATGVG